jgi:glycosyltransferase involved in cell wall biosynthesis
MISIVFPTYNEAWSIREVLRRASAGLRRAGEDHELFVEDNSEVLR